MNKLKSKFNEMKNGINKKLGLNLLGILAVFAIMIGVTYAGLRFTGITDQNSINSGKISMSYKESSNTISIDNALPITDDQGKIGNDYFDFSITSNASTNANDNVGVEVAYNLILSPKSIESGKEALDPSQIKVYLTKVEGESEIPVVEPTSLSSLEKITDDFSLYSTSNLHKQNNGKITTNYRLRSWISFDVNPLEDWDSTKSYQYKFKVDVNATGNRDFDPNVNIYPKSQDESGANAPILTSNMIPVYYDEGSNNWKIANIKQSGTANSWYDYDGKKWANAVTLHKSSYEEEISSEDQDVNIPVISAERYDFYFPFDWDNWYKITETNKFTFTTGDTAGSLKFIVGKMMISSESIKLNGTALTGVSDSDDNYDSKDRYTVTLEANTAYTLETTFEAYSEDSASVYVEFLEIPSNLKVAFKASSSSWSKSTLYYPTIYKGYSFDTLLGKFYLSDSDDAAITSSSVGRFFCPTDAGNSLYSCEEVYEIREVKNGVITKVKTHKRKVITPASTYSKANPGTVIPMSSISTMWVWVPRYKYTYFSTNTPFEIPITFENGTASTGTIKCTDAISYNGTATGNVSQTCTDTTNGSLIAGTSTYTHPAFTFGNQELTGIWVGKFINSSGTDRNYYILPDKQVDTAGFTYAFNRVRKMEIANNIYGFPQGSSTYSASTGEITDDTNRMDTHLIKNMEWGAISYLSHSKYGKNSEVFLNNSSRRYTGRSGGNVAGSTQIKGTYTSQTSTSLYNYYGYYTYDGYLLKYGTDTKSTTRDLSKVSSTTGNIYGIYDMVGPISENVMGNMTNSSLKFQAKSASAYWNETDRPLDKYYDKYSYGTVNTEFTRGKLGDGIVEISSSGTTIGWYGDGIYMPYNDIPWFLRGTGYSETASGGIFRSHITAGDSSFGYRAILAVW